MADIEAARIGATLFRDGNYLGRLDPNGVVTGVRGRMGMVTSQGEVRDAEGMVRGSADESGLLLNAAGDMCGMVDASGSVWAGDEMLGQVVGTGVNHGGAALLFLLRDEPAVSLTAEPMDSGKDDGYTLRRDREPVRVVAALPPKPKSNRVVYGFAHFAVLGGILWGLYLSVGWGMNTYKKSVASTPSVPARSSNEMPTASNTNRNPGTQRSTRIQQTPKANTETVLARQYASMDGAYNRRDTGGFYAHHASDFRFVNTDGGTDNLPRSKQYMGMRFSPNHPKRFLSCSISQRVVSVKAVSSTKCRAVINQIVFTETEAKGKTRTEIRQEDTWRNDGGHWRCVRSHILSRKATQL